MSYGNRIKELRTKRNITQKELAESMGILPQSLIKYEKGKSSFTLKFREKLLKVFTPYEVEYIETGTWKRGAQNIIGNNNNQAGRDQILREAVKQVREEDMAQIHDAIVNAIIQMMQGFDEEQKIKALQCITEIKLGK